MAHFQKAKTPLAKNALYSTEVSDRKQVWRMEIPLNKKADIGLNGGDNLTVEPHGLSFKFSEGKPPSKNNRIFTITANSMGKYVLHAKHSNGSVWGKLKINVITSTEQTLRRQAIKILEHKSISKMNFQIGSMRVTPAKVRAMKNLIQSGELSVGHNQHLGKVGAYFRDNDQVVFPFPNISSFNQKANACHELLHATMDHAYVGNQVKACQSEAVGYVAQLIFARVEKPGLTLKQIGENKIFIQAFKAAGQVLAGKQISKVLVFRLCNTILADPLYRSQKGKSIKFNGI